ncbi:MAG: acyltransferase, partial [Ferruginibacter sp.]|nr:acyltransferase [Cytophagales bacterium]
MTYLKKNAEGAILPGGQSNGEAGHLLTPGYLNQLDFVRAIASLWVAVYHLSGKKYFIGTYGYLGVPMFFVLSGFVICWSLPPGYGPKQLGTFLAKRLVRIEPPYVVSIALVLILNSLTALLTGSSYQIDGKNVLLHLAYLNNFTGYPYLNPVYWTLGIEFQFYLFIGLIFPFFTANKYRACLVLIAFGLTSLWEANFHPVYRTVFGFSTLFSLGMAGYLFKTARITRFELLAFAVFHLALCYLTQGWLIALTGLVTLFLILKFNYRHRLIRFFARISFSLYLV